MLSASPCAKIEVENSSRHIVEPRLRDFAVGHRLRQRRPEEILRVELLAGFLVQAGHCRGSRRVDRAPVGHHEIGIAPVCLQHLIEEPVVFARVASVHLVVGAHHRARTTALDGDLEGEQVRFAHRGRVDSRVEDDPVGFLRVEGEVLGRRDDVAALRAVDHGARHQASEQRVLREIFEIAAAARVANKIGRAAKKDIQPVAALRPRLPGLEVVRGPHPMSRRGRDRTASRSLYRRGGRRLGWRRQALRPFLAAPECRGAVSRARSPLSRSIRPVWACRPKRRDDAMEKRQLLLLRHLLERHLRTLSGRQRGIVPRPVSGDRGEGQGDRQDHERGCARRSFSGSMVKPAHAKPLFFFGHQHRQNAVTRKNSA